MKKTISLILSICLIISVFAGMNISAAAAESGKAPAKATDGTHKLTIVSQQGLFEDLTRSYKAGDTFSFTINLKTKKYTELSTISLRYDDTQLRVGKYETLYSFPDATFSEVANERVLVWATITSLVDTRNGGEYVTFTGKIKDGFNADQTLTVDFQTLGVADVEKVVNPKDGTISYKEKYGTDQTLIAWSNVVAPQDFEISISAPAEQPTQPATAEPTTQEPTTQEPTTQEPTTAAPSATEPTETTQAPTATEATETTQAPIATEATETTQASAPGDFPHNADIRDVIPSYDAAKTFYFYMPREWRNIYNDTYDGESLDSCSAGIYWWDTSYNPAEYYGTDRNSWPGYNITETEAADSNIFVAKCPADISTVIFNNTVDGGDYNNKEDNPVRYFSALQTSNLTAEFYMPGEDKYGFYPNGTGDVNGMIFVCNLKDTEVNEFSGKSTYNGAWFYYYGDGEYGIYKTRAEAEAANAVYANGVWPSDYVEPATEATQFPTATEASTASPIGSNKIRFDASYFSNYSIIYCHIWERGGDAFFPWQSKKETCTKVSGNIYEYDLSMLDKSTTISGGLKAGTDYCVIFSANTGAYTYDTTFGIACIGDTVKLTGEKLENPVDSAKKAYEAVWTNNSDKFGPHLALTSIGNIVGSKLCPNEKGEEVIGDWIIAYYESSNVDAVDVLTNAYPRFGITSVDQVETIFNYVKSKETFEDEDAIYDLLLEAFWQAHTDYPSPGTIIENGDFDYVVLPNSKGLEVAAYYGNATNVTIPKTINDMPVVSIGEASFKRNHDIVSVIIPEGVTTINEEAFKLCESMEKVYVPASIAYIGENAFSGCDKLNNVSYGGSTRDWRKVEIAETNDILLDAAISYNAQPSYVEEVTAPVTQPQTQVPFQPATVAPTQPPTRVPIQPVSAAPTEPVTAAPTQPETAAPTEPVTAAPTEPVETKPVPDSPTVEPTAAPVNTDKSASSTTVKKPTVKKSNPVSVTVKQKTVKAKKLKKKKLTVKAITVKNAAGKVTYKKLSGATRLKLNSKTGKITVKKGTKKGTYKIKVKITVKGNSKYQSKTITKTIRIRVK